MPSRMMTTSRPSSTMRLARSMVSSATIVCSSDGRSNVDATTSPFCTQRFMSVTSSGRSSTSSTMRWTSGLFVSIDRAICFITVVLPAFGGDTMRPRWPLPMGEIRSTMRAVMFSGSPGTSRLQPLVGEQRGQVLEARALAGHLGVDAVDRVDAQHAPGSSRCVRPGGRAGDVVALAQRELADLLDRDVDVVLARQVADEAQEAVALVAQVEQTVDVDRLALEGLLGVRSVGRPVAALATVTSPATTATVALAVALGLTLASAP